MHRKRSHTARFGNNSPEWRGVLNEMTVIASVYPACSPVGFYREFYRELYHDVGQCDTGAL